MLPTLAILIAFMGTTHLLWGIAAAELSLDALQLAGMPLPPHPQVVVVAAIVGLLTGLLPDIDQPSSMISNPGREAKKATYSILGIKRHSLVSLLFALPFALSNLPVYLLAQGFNSVFGHRGIMHSLGAGTLWALAITLPTVIFAGAQWWVVGVFALSGYVSHLATDAMTISGIPDPFWPLSLVVWHEEKTKTLRSGREVKKQVKHRIVPMKLHLLPAALRVSASGPFNTLMAILGLMFSAALVVSSVFGYAWVGRMLALLLGHRS